MTDDERAEFDALKAAVLLIVARGVASPDGSGLFAWKVRDEVRQLIGVGPNDADAFIRTELAFAQQRERRALAPFRD